MLKGVTVYSQLFLQTFELLLLNLLHRRFNFLVKKNKIHIRLLFICYVPFKGSDRSLCSMHPFYFLPQVSMYYFLPDEGSCLYIFNSKQLLFIDTFVDGYLQSFPKSPTMSVVVHFTKKYNRKISDNPRYPRQYLIPRLNVLPT